MNLSRFCALVAAVLVFGATSSANASWNYRSRVQSVMVIENGDIEFFLVPGGLQSSSTSPAPSCRPNAFVIPANRAGRDQMLSVLLAAQLSGKQVWVTWDGAGDYCAPASLSNDHTAYRITIVN